MTYMTPSYNFMSEFMESVREREESLQRTTYYEPKRI